MGATGDTTGYLKAFAGSTGSNTIGDYAWYYSNAGSTTHPVGTKPANELGLHDMSGNVWEWCWDWWGAPYPTGPLTNYRGAASGTYRGLPPLCGLRGRLRTVGGPRGQGGSLPCVAAGVGESRSDSGPLPVAVAGLCDRPLAWSRWVRRSAALPTILSTCPVAWGR